MKSPNTLHTLNPLPTDLEAALKEIGSLQLQLINANQRLAKMAEKLLGVQKAMSGIAKKLATFEAGVDLKAIAAHFTAHKYHWWTRQDVVRELKTFDPKAIDMAENSDVEIDPKV